MEEDLFEVEMWRDRWFYKFGSRYTGPFSRRNDAIDAAHQDLGIFRTGETTPVRSSLAKVASFAELG